MMMKAIKYILLGLSVCVMYSGFAQNPKGSKSNNGWTSIGPNNITGRVLTVCIDQTNNLHLYAGAAGSGLWTSTNGGATWIKNNAFSGSAAVSAIVQDNTGALYVGTGDGMATASSDGFASPGVKNTYYTYGIKGDGLYKSTDNGASFTRLPDSEDWEEINAMKFDSYNNKLYVATDIGLMVSSDGGNSFTMASAQPIKCTDIKVSGTGIVTYCNATNIANAYISTDGGASFNSLCGTNKLPANASRISLAIAPTCPDMIYALVADANGRFAGVYQSRNQGETWRTIAPIGGLFDPFGGANGQICNQIVVSDKDSSLIFLGGRALCQGQEYDSEQNFNWNTINSTLFIYNITYHNDNLYLCTRVGIQKYNITNRSFSTINNYLATMQASTLAIANDGRFMSGIPNGGIAYLENPKSIAKSAKEINTSEGDAGNCIFSYIKPEALFYTGYYGYCYRQASISSDAQAPADWYGNTNRTTLMDKEKKYPRWHPDENNLSNTYAIARANPLAFWESTNDYNSIDSVMYIPDKTYVTGDVICVKSSRNNYPIWYKYTGQDTLKRNQDTIMVQDIVTSRFFIGGASHKYSQGANVAVGAPVYMSTNALDFANTPSFTCVFRTKDSTEQVLDLQVSQDGDHLFVLTKKYLGNTAAYSIYRVSGFDTYRTPEEIDVSKYVYDQSAGFTTDNDRRRLVDDTLVSDISGIDITSICLDPQNNDILLYTTNGDGVGNYRIYAIINALSATLADADIVSKEGSGIPEKIAVYSALVEMSNSNIAYIGTEQGVYKSENFETDSPTWVLYNNGINVKVPVFKLIQQTKLLENNHSITYSADGQAIRIEFPGVSNYGSIYAATSGLGIFIDSTYFNAIADSPRGSIAHEKTNIVVYPNPTADFATINFDINSDCEATIQLIDVTGKIIYSKDMGNIVAGNHNQRIDCSNLSNGIYFVNIKTTNSNRTVKLVIQK